MSKLRRLFSGRLDQKLDRPKATPGVLGNGTGLVSVPGRVNYVYVRMAGGAVAEVFNSRVRAQYDLPVVCGCDPLEPNKFQVLSVMSSSADMTDFELGMGYAPASRYRWMFPGGGQDPLFVEGPQIMPGRIIPAGGLKMRVYPLVPWTGSAWAQVGGSTEIDLSASVPASAGYALFVLVTISSSGTVVTTTGTSVLLADLGLDDLPPVPANTRYVLGAVRLYNGQTAIREGRSETDILDLRWPIYHAHGAEGLSLNLDDLGDVAITDPADGEVVGRASGEWVNRTLAEAGIAAAADLTAHTGNTSNPHSVTKSQVGLGSVANILDKLDATAAPTANDDSGDGYSVGSRWIDVTNDKAYVCLDATVGAAVWQEIGGGGGASAFTDLTDAPASYTGQAGKYPKVKATEDGLEFSTPAGGGDVVGPASAIDGHLAVFDGATGKLIKDGGAPGGGGISEDGWIDPSETWTYASATTFTVSGDVTSIYTPGIKIKLTQTTAKYFYVIKSEYSDPNTTITVTGGSDYSLANAAISGNCYSRVQSPAGFPDWFNYTPTLTAATTNPTMGNSTLVGTFKIDGRSVTTNFRLVVGNSGWNAGSGVYSISLPTGSGTAVNSERAIGSTIALDSGSTWRLGNLRIGATGINANNESANTWGNSTPQIWAANDTWTGTIIYQI